MSGGRFRGFSVVVHNVYQTDKSYWVDTVNKLKYDRSVVSVEEYPESPGQFHCHIFTQHKNPCSKMKLLDYLQQAQKGHIDERVPAPEGKTLGRIQVDPLRGTIEQATAYLTQSTTKKDKVCDVAPVAFNKRHITCSCGYKNISQYMKYDFPGGKGLCYKCWWRAERDQIIQRNDPLGLDEHYDLQRRILEFWGSMQP